MIIETPSFVNSSVFKMFSVDTESQRFQIPRVEERFRKASFSRASSYEPGNRAGSVTGTNFAVCSYGKFQPGRPG